MKVRQLPSSAVALAKSAHAQRRSQKGIRLVATPALAGVFLALGLRERMGSSGREEIQRERAPADVVEHGVDESLVGNPVDHLAVQGPDGKGSGFFFLGADGQNQRNLIELRLSDFFIEALGAAVDFGPKTCGF